MTTFGLLGDRLLAFGLPGGYEWIVLLVLGLLIFGRRLPEVGRSLGRGIVEFKRGIKGIDDEIDQESSKPSGKLTEWPKQSLESSARQEGSDQKADESEKVTSGQESANDEDR
jgi:sec-independent protein translocase protein TatA